MNTRRVRGLERSQTQVKTTRACALAPTVKAHARKLSDELYAFVYIMCITY